MELDPWLLRNLVCPRDKTHLDLQSASLVCREAHRYSVVYGIPIMLLQDVIQTHPAAIRSIEEAQGDRRLVTEQQTSSSSSRVDQFVQRNIAATHGILYKSLNGRLEEYPIPELRAPRGHGHYFLDLGCNWGRWCIAAGKIGYTPVGIDPSLEAICAAKRVAEQLGMAIHYVVADARYLPFADLGFDCVFSYSVLQHFEKGDVRQALREVRRVLKIGGKAMIQMANVFGLRCMYHQGRRRFRQAKNFEIRYWSPWELKATFSRLVGPARLAVDGYFSLNAQISDVNWLPRKYRPIIYSSEFLRRLSTKVSLMTILADSLYVNAVKLEAS